MSQGLQVINKHIKAPATMNRLTMALGFDAGDEKGVNKARSYAATVLAEIEKTAGDPKKDLTGCSPTSIGQCMVDAASFGVKIDGRQHAHLVKYGRNATLQIGYRGYLAKIKEHYPDADFVVECIFKGDEVSIEHKDGNQEYTFKKASAFNENKDDFEGVLFVVTYTDNGRLVRKVNTVTKSRIERARKAAKQDFIWSSDYFEKAKAAAIKASCKIHFASLSGISDVIKYDNHNNYDPQKGIKREGNSAGSIVDNLNEQIIDNEPTAPEPEQEAQEPVQDVIDLEEVKEPVPAQNAFPGCTDCSGTGIANGQTCESCEG
tara:strand:- start:3121 stop:4077 length:957 start_codon:yes stop_codon:yes gene_type:complete